MSPTSSKSNDPISNIDTENPNQSAAATFVDEKKGTCPMKRADGGYIFSWKKKNPHSAAFLSDAESSQSVPEKANPTAASGGCPMKQQSAVLQYNVYSQPIDPTNNMPSVANQLPAPQQTQPLSTQRISSTIPKGGAVQGETWLYPSPQMFYNALSRKNKLGDTQEDDMNSVVALHNNMNEKTWAKILQWEAVSQADQNYEVGPKLLKFIGRPSDLSPKARFKHSFLNHPLPFDRHDWTVLRHDGTQVRYLIDYYFDESQASHSPDSALPSLHERNSVNSILVDVRPALDSPHNIFDRFLKMPYSRFIRKNTLFQPLPLFPTTALKNQVPESRTVWEHIQASVTHDSDTSVTNTHPSVIPDQDIAKTQATQIAQTFSLLLKNCQQAQKNVEQCQHDAECAKASLALTLCIGKVLCPLQHHTVTSIIQQEDKTDSKQWNAQMDAALENLATCVHLKSEQATLAKQRHPDAFQL